MIYTLSLLYLAVLIQGGFFASAYLPLGLLALIGTPFIVKKVPNIKYLLPFIILTIIYIISVITTGITTDSLKYGAKIVVYLLFWLLISNAKDKDKITKSIVILGFSVAILGIIAFSGVIPIGGMVNINRLQGVFQYANAMGIFMAACSLVAYEADDKKYTNMIIPMEIALLLTQSAGSILFYIAGLFSAILLKYKNYRAEKLSEIIIRFFISFLAAAIMYLLPSDIKFITIIVLVVLIVFQKKVGVLCNKIKLPVLPIIACVGAVIAGLSIVRGGRYIGTFAERLIQISDGISAIKSNIFTGLGPGNWSILKYAWQTFDYTATYIHSSIIQAGVDAGIGAVIVIIIMFIYYFISPINNKPFIYMAGSIIIVHSLVDATLNFTGIVFMLMALFCIRSDEEVNINVPRWSAILVTVLVLPLFLGLTSWNYRYNQVVKSRDTNGLIQYLDSLPVNSYTERVALADILYKAGRPEEFNGQVRKIPYKTADVYYMEAKELIKEQNYEEALDVDYLCINESKMQSFGYDLAADIINKLPEEEQKKQEAILNEYKSDAQKSRHLLSYIIHNRKD